MSAPAESTTTGGNTGPEETSRLDQPRDAVQMENITQSTSTALPGDKKGGDDSVKQTEQKHATEPSSSTTAAITSEPADQAPVVTPASPKGKEKEVAPPPPSKEMTHDPAMAIGLVDDKATPGSPDSGPVCNITLLLTSGSRHPYKIDAKYLSRRNVAIPDETEDGQPDPFSISIYTLKELILREWRSDWEAKPASPSSIRLIHFGKLLDDKEQLKSKPFTPVCRQPILFTNRRVRVSIE